MVKGLDVFRGDFFLKVVDAQITFVTNAVNSASLSPQSTSAVIRNIQSQ
jgi:hypothetical protein